MLIALRPFICILLFAGIGIAHAADGPGAPENARSPRLIPVCARTLYVACGLVDRQGNWVVEPTYSQLFASGDFWIVGRNSGLVGLLDASGKTLIAPSLSEIRPFSEGLAVAQRWGDKPRRLIDQEPYGYIDTTGRFVIPPRYESAGDFSNGLAGVSKTVNGHLETAVIDRQNRIVTPFNRYETVTSYAFGLAVVSRRGKTGVIDTHGRLVLPLAARHNNLTVVAPSRLLEWTENQRSGAKRYRLLDARGRVLFEVSGKDAWIQDPSEGRAFFANAPGQAGLLDIQRARVLVAPRADWVDPSPFSDGVAWVTLACAEDDARLLIDRNGRQILRTTAKGIDAFHAGVAMISNDKGKSELIDRNGKLVHGFEFDAGWTLWYGDVVKFTQTTTLENNPEKTVWMNAKGGIIASVEPQACGIEIVRNVKGQTIWPTDVANTCAANRLRDANDTGSASGAVAAIVQEAAQREQQWAREVDQRNGYEFGPLLSGDVLVPLNAEWQHGPATIRLDGPARFDLPGGFRYLPPDAVRKLPGNAALAGKLPVALVSPEDGRWVARLIIARQGYVPMDNVQFDADSLTETIDYYGSRFDIDAPPGEVHMASAEWVEKPVWNAAHHRLSWAYRLSGVDYSRSSARGPRFDNHTELDSITLGRTYAVVLQIFKTGLFRDGQQPANTSPLNALAQGIRFDQGARYEDHRASDPTAALGLEGFVTGPKPGETQRSEEAIGRVLKQDAQERNAYSWAALTRFFLLLALAVPVWKWYRNRRAKRH